MPLLRVALLFLQVAGAIGGNIRGIKFISPDVSSKTESALSESLLSIPSQQPTPSTSASSNVTAEPSSSPTKLPPSFAPTPTPSLQMIFLRERDINFQQTFTGGNLTFKQLSSTNFSDGLHEIFASALNIPPQTTVYEFDRNTCSYPTAGKYRCYLTVYSTYQMYNASIDAIALSVSSGAASKILSLRMGQQIQVTSTLSQKLFDSPTKSPITALGRVVGDPVKITDVLLSAGVISGVVLSFLLLLTFGVCYFCRGFFCCPIGVKRRCKVGVDVELDDYMERGRYKEHVTSTGVHPVLLTSESKTVDSSEASGASRSKGEGDEGVRVGEIILCEKREEETVGRCNSNNSSEKRRDDGGYQYDGTGNISDRSSHQEEPNYNKSSHGHDKDSHDEYHVIDKKESENETENDHGHNEGWKKRTIRGLWKISDAPNSRHHPIPHLDANLHREISPDYKIRNTIFSVMAWRRKSTTGNCKIDSEKSDRREKRSSPTRIMREYKKELIRRDLDLEKIKKQNKNDDEKEDDEMQISSDRLISPNRLTSIQPMTEVAEEIILWPDVQLKSVKSKSNVDMKDNGNSNRNEDDEIDQYNRVNHTDIYGSAEENNSTRRARGWVRKSTSGKWEWHGHPF